MTQWTPQTRDGESKGISPYYYGGQRIQGFRGSHWSGSARLKDYGSFTIMPVTGYLKTFARERASGFMHKNEISTPAYYSCMLLNYMILTEITCTARSGLFKFSLIEKKPTYILVTPNSDEGKAYVKIDREKNEIYGFNPVTRVNNDSSAFAGFNGYFVVRFNRSFDSFGCYYQMEKLSEQTEISGKKDIGAYAMFDIKSDEVILAKAGTSFTSIEAARANLDAEMPDWDFNRTRSATEKLWNDALAVVSLEGGKKEDYSKFYTALYRSMLFPRTFSDVDGSYPDFKENGTVSKTEPGHIYYDDFYLNDEQKVKQALMRIVAPDCYDDMLKSAKLKAINGGWLPDSVLRNTTIPYHYPDSEDPIDRQKKVKTILQNEYNAYDGGIPGNDNAGQKSAWYVFSALGLYPTQVGTDEYLVSSPVFEQVKLNLNPKYYPGQTFEMNTSGKDSYEAFRKAKLNGKEIPFIIKHEDLRKGGKLEFTNKN